MPAQSTLLSLLAEGKYSMSTGRVLEAAALVAAHPKEAGRLIELLWHDSPGVAKRAADVLERVSREPSPALKSMLEKRKPALIGLMAETTGNKTRWNLALTIPRLALTPEQARRVAEILNSYLLDKSSIVKTAAMQGLADLALRDKELLPGVLDRLRILSRSGTPAMRARGRLLLHRLERLDRPATPDRPDRPDQESPSRKA